MNIRIANEKVPGIKDPLFKRALDAHVPVEIPTNSTEEKALAKCSLLVSQSLKLRGDRHCAGIECCALAFVTVVVDGLLNFVLTLYFHGKHTESASFVHRLKHSLTDEHSVVN